MTELGVRSILPDRIFKAKPSSKGTAEQITREALLREGCSNIRVESTWHPAETVVFSDGTSIDLPDRYEITGLGDK